MTYRSGPERPGTGIEKDEDSESEGSTREVSRICPDAVPSKISLVENELDAEEEEDEEEEGEGAQETESMIAPLSRFRGFAFFAADVEGSPDGNEPM